MSAGDLITRDGQIEWRGTLLGAGTAYRMTQLEGWLDLPSMRSGDVDLDNAHGAQPGHLVADARTITLSFNLHGAPAVFAEAESVLRRITAPAETTVEEPLVVRWAGVTGMVLARCHRRLIPTPLEYAAGLTRGAIQWKATNPRILQLPRLQQATTAPTPGAGGLTWPLTWPLVWGSAQAGGEMVLTNTGNAEAQPVWRITGPCTGPAIRNADTGATLAFDPDYVVPEGQRLTLTHADRSVLLDGGVSRSYRLARRGWFTLPPGVTRVRFDSTDGRGQIECLYHHTNL